MRTLTDWLRSAYRWVDRRSGGVLEILGGAIQSFGQARAAEAAAGMAYYALFSLFPLLLALVAASGYVLESEQIRRDVLTLVTEAIPISQGLIERNVERVLQQRGTIGLLGLVGLIWSATGVFAVLARNINRAWPGTEPRSLLKQRLVALAMVAALALLLAVALISMAVADLLPRLQLSLRGTTSLYETPLWVVLSNLIPWLLIFLLFLGLYRWVPTTEVKWTAAFWGALVAALAWEVATRALTWYLSSEWVQYELVYGSLGAVVALLLWVYISSWITLFGAHLGAAIAQRTCGEQSPKRKQAKGTYRSEPGRRSQ